MVNESNVSSTPPPPSSMVSSKKKPTWNCLKKTDWMATLLSWNAVSTGLYNHQESGTCRYVEFLNILGFTSYVHYPCILIHETDDFFITFMSPTSCSSDPKTSLWIPLLPCLKPSLKSIIWALSICSSAPRSILPLQVSLLPRFSTSIMFSSHSTSVYAAESPPSQDQSTSQYCNHVWLPGQCYSFSTNNRLPHIPRHCNKIRPAQQRCPSLSRQLGSIWSTLLRKMNTLSVISKELRFDITFFSGTCH